MLKGSFDPTHAVEFDLPRGVVQGQGQRMLLVPANVIDEMLRYVSAAAAASLARAIGAATGERAAARLGGAQGLRAASMETVVSVLGGELAIAGAGALHVERWGRALVVVVSNAAVKDDACVAAIVEGALSTATERAVACLALAREESTVRVLVGSAATIERARVWIAKGTPWGDVLARLQSRGEA